MCDLVAPLLVVIDDEVTVYSCFSLLMERMIQWEKTLYNNSFYNALTFSNFPTGNQMDHNFANMRVLMQVREMVGWNNIFAETLSFLGSWWKPLRQYPAEWRLFSFLFLLSLVRKETKHIHALSSSFSIFSNEILKSSFDRFLLDFKREFSYPRVYRVWETIWAAGNKNVFSRYSFRGFHFNFLYQARFLHHNFISS